MSSRPLCKHSLWKGSISKGMGFPPVGVRVCASRLTSISRAWGPVAWLKSQSMREPSRTMGRMPFLKQLLKKMSAKLGARMTRKP